jgi:hypothetical protein
MNDNPIQIPKLTPADLANPDVVRTLEGSLAAAKAGQVVGVVVVMAMGGDGIGLQIAGTHPSALVTGCQQASRQLLDRMFAPKPKSGIVIPRRGMQ